MAKRSKTTRNVTLQFSKDRHGLDGRRAAATRAGRRALPDAGRAGPRRGPGGQTPGGSLEMWPWWSPNWMVFKACVDCVEQNVVCSVPAMSLVLFFSIDEVGTVGDIEVTAACIFGLKPRLSPQRKWPSSLEGGSEITLRPYDPTSNQLTQPSSG